MDDKELIREFVIEKWAEKGLTCEQVEGYIEKVAMKKQADIGATLTETIPIFAFAAPAAGSAIYYLLTHPGYEKEQARKIRMKSLKYEILKQRAGNENV